MLHVPTLHITADAMRLSQRCVRFIDSLKVLNLLTETIFKRLHLDFVTFQAILSEQLPTSTDIP